jgi:hypothetical protein
MGSYRDDTPTRADGRRRDGIWLGRTGQKIGHVAQGAYDGPRQIADQTEGWLLLT